MKKIISIDVAAKQFTSIVVRRVNIDYIEKYVQIFYDGCMSPITIDLEEYDKLLEGHIVELHQGEVALVVEEFFKSQS
jgi:hypothetical protein